MKILHQNEAGAPGSLEELEELEGRGWVSSDASRP